MNRPYKEFVEKRLGKRIDYDKAYGYQCVDLIKQYLDECLGWGKIGAIGNANQVPKNLLKKGFGELDPKKTIIQGDIIVHTQGIYGHIAIVDHILGDFVYVLEQNGSGKDSGSGEGQNAIRIHPYKIDRFQTILRNTDIVANYNKEVEYVEDKIEERANLLKITTEYRESMQHLSKK